MAYFVADDCLEPLVLSPPVLGLRRSVAEK